MKNTDFDSLFDGSIGDSNLDNIFGNDDRDFIAEAKKRNNPINANTRTKDFV